MIFWLELLTVDFFSQTDLSAKEKVIEDMRLTLEEQEQTQVEQDRVLEAKLEEADWLAKGKLRLLSKLISSFNFPWFFFPFQK